MAEATAKNTTALEEFREELPVVWASIPDKGLFFGLLLVWLAIFQFVGNQTFGYIKSASLFAWLNMAYSTPGSEDSHGSLIPVVVLGLIWWKRQELQAVPKAIWWPGLIGLAGAMLLHIFGYLIQQPRASAVAMLVGIYALIATVWGWRLAWAMAFPYGLMVFCIPISALAEPVTIPLRRLSTDITVFVTRHLLGIPIIQEGVQLADPRGLYQYEVAAACSGINSLLTLVLLSTVYAFVSLKKFWKRAVMIAAALPLALANNILRLVTIIVAAEAFGRKAGDFVHEWFGFLTFALGLAGMMALGHWLREPEPPNHTPKPEVAPALST